MPFRHAGTGRHAAADRAEASVTQGLLADSKAKTALGQQGDVVMIDPATFAKRVAREEGNWTAVIQREAITLD
ncbi:hypothetical protein A9P79_09980 [Cupriavidus taiwanensis]|nr:hypothetical protein A9P79_09980 [Cupriavidus taiwanensis]